ncbi:MAG TPA: hypothetical protein VLK30_13250 [Candidatus Limnocylindrales bacterium]|nr:hypothetical protein [Candidatus Limnocylindrales bacterium]
MRVTFLLQLCGQAEDRRRGVRDLCGHLDRPQAGGVDVAAGAKRGDKVEIRERVGLDQLLRPQPQRFGPVVGAGRAAPLTF